MSLATRCPSCGTVFRVVQDQLRVSEGWVRCGRCNKVFDAAEVLFDIDNGSPVQLALGAVGSADPVGQLRRPADWPQRLLPDPVDEAADALHDNSPEDADEELIVTDWIAPVAPVDTADPIATPPADTGAAPAFWPASGDGGDGRTEPGFDRPLAGFDRPLALPTPTTAWPMPGRAATIDDAELAEIRPLSSTAPPPSTPTASLAPTTHPGTLPNPNPDSAAAVPGFLRQAERAARWQRPAMRLALAGAVLMLALGALGQAALLMHDALAAHLPASAPAMRALCRVAGCSLQPLRRIEALSVDSSALNRVEGSDADTYPNAYRLQLVLRNRADPAVMMPALDLTLTDPQGQRVSRRVLTMAELGVAQSALAAGQQLPVQALLTAGDRRIAGYTVELFYP